ncbi:FtsX-like permease family protein [Kitasatospora sp. NPDC092948]|uniref:FtsX-like permease family protein n=1 Tax=Kitasatospora sp. NPDC092948 TaxID=3364088 RepID=UPI0038281965
MMAAMLARAQLRRRPAGFAGLAVALLLAVATVTALGALLGAEHGVPAAERREIRGPGLGLIVGAFGEITVLVAFFVALNTLGFALRHQYRDLALLRTVAATPRQIRQLLRRQAALTVLLVAAPGALLGAAAARSALVALQHRAMAAPHARIGGLLPAAAVATAVTLLVATLAATLIARQVTAPTPAAALADSSGPDRRPGVARLLAAVAALAGGALLVRLAATRPAAEVDKAAQATLLGTLVLLVAVALAGPLLVPLATVPLGRALRALLPVAGWQADANLRGYARRLASAAVPIALLTGLTATMATMTGTALHAAAGPPEGATSATDTWLRQAELGLLGAFGAIATVTTLVALTGERRREFALLRLLGATRADVLRVVTLEAALTAAVGLLLGGAVTAVTTVAFSLAATGSPVPTVPAATCARIAAAATLLTVPAMLAAATVAMRRPPAEVAGGAQD